MKFASKYLHLIFPALLVTVVAVIAFANYIPGTYLSGWDTLHPEFNFALYFKRTFFGVWQEHQGLGAVASQSHAGDLPRLLVYYPLSWFLSQDFLRWAYVFLSLLLGPLGVYFFLKYITGKPWIGYSCGLLYLLNLGTLQHFYLPLEMFATHFATLPWLFLFVLRFLESGGRKNLAIFSLITLLATPVSHTPTLFYVYFLALSLFLVTYLFVHKFSKNPMCPINPTSEVGMKLHIGFKTLLPRAFLVFFATLVINSFWLLPNIYFIVNHGQDVLNSKIHSQLYNRAFYTSQAFATMQDAALIRGYLFDWGRYDFEQKGFVDLFIEWQGHLSSPLVKSLGYLVFVTVVLGIAVAFLKKRLAALVFFPVFLLSFLSLALDLGFLSSTDILREALRFHFTKFSILLMFMFALYFGVFLEFLGVQLRKILRSDQKAGAILASIVTLSFIFYMLPAFSGNLISKSEKVLIPKEYFQTFKFLNEQKAGRIANFPVNTYWSWVYYSWRYEGAGFLWFGLENPLLDREFDRWSRYSENYYWEISYALYSKNLKLFESVLDKYQINWLLVDENAFNPSSSKSVFNDELEEMIKGSGKITLAKSLSKIKIYQVYLDPGANNFVSLRKDIPVLGPKYNWTNLDRAYLENGNYINGDYINGSSAPDIYYPFRSLFTGRSQQDLEFSVRDKGDYFLFKKKLPEGLKDYYIEVPDISDQDLTWVDPEDLSRIKNLPKDIFFDGNIIEVKIPKVGGLFSAEIVPGEKREFWFPDFPHSLSYLISTPSRNLKGVPLNFWLENINSRRADMEAYLPASPDFNTSYFIQPPMEKDGLGYALHFDQLRFGNEISQNELGTIKINPFPFDFLVGLKLKKKSGLPQQKLIGVEVEHPNPSLYVVNNTSALPATLVLSQAYEKGWRAYTISSQFSVFSFQLEKILPFIFGEEIKSHVLVNNWANGWRLSGENKKIVIIFLPQYLEYAGGGVLLVYLSWLIIWNHRASKSFLFFKLL